MANIMNWYDVFDKETIEDIKNNKDDLGYVNGYCANNGED